MIKRTLYFGNPAYLQLDNNNLFVNYPDDFKARKRVPVEDVGLVILDHAQLTITQPLLNALLENNTVVMTCDSRHMPKGLWLNLEGHHKQQEHWQIQVSVSEALKGRLWKQLIVQKIKNQAALLKSSEHETDNMDYWAHSVKKWRPG